MKITKQMMRAITKDNFLTNSLTRAIVICARSDKELHTAFLQFGAMIAFRRRFLHNELNEYDKKIIKLTEWALDEFGLPGGDDAWKSEAVGHSASANGAESGNVVSECRKAASGPVH